MDFIYYLDLFGTFVFAVSGAILAMRKKMDIFGVIIVGFVTAVGGGTLRDMLIGQTPVFWLSDNNYLILIIAGTVATFVLSSRVLKIHHVLRIADALGIGTFTIIGIRRGISGNLSVTFAIIMGMTTAVFGGAIRDILCREMPLILSREIYATACLIGGFVFFALKQTNLPDNVITLIAISVIITIRLVSVKFNLHLPRNETIDNN